LGPYFLYKTCFHLQWNKRIRTAQIQQNKLCI